MEIKQLTDKLNLSNKKICNYRNHIMQLKNDLKVTQNVRICSHELLFKNNTSILRFSIYLTKCRHYLMKLEILN